jgi:RNA polymerase sigma-70 factor (sigma-E family)
MQARRHLSSGEPAEPEIRAYEDIAGPRRNPGCRCLVYSSTEQCRRQQEAGTWDRSCGPAAAWRNKENCGVRRDPEHADLERFLAEHGEGLLRIAIALTGSRADGEDLLQAALERLVPRWPTIAGGAAESYVRRTLYNLAADGWRRRGAWRRTFTLLRAQDAAPGTDAMAEVDLRDALVRLLAQLPPRQRAVIVLRYWEQLSEAETAALLGCPAGTVKSAAARGLQRLRDLAESWPDAGAARRWDTPRGPAPGSGPGPGTQMKLVEDEL